MPAVKFFACLDFERKSSFCKRLGFNPHGAQCRENFQIAGCRIFQKRLFMIAHEENTLGIDSTQTFSDRPRQSSRSDDRTKAVASQQKVADSGPDMVRDLKF